VVKHVLSTHEVLGSILSSKPNQTFVKEKGKSSNDIEDKDIEEWRKTSD
jgi:hypothetical protein